MEHLIISTNKDLRIHDWTPFYNCIGPVGSNPFQINIFHKGDLITAALNQLSNHNWEYRNTFTDNKYIYFVLIKRKEDEHFANEEIYRKNESDKVVDTFPFYSRLRRIPSPPKSPPKSSPKSSPKSPPKSLNTIEISGPPLPPRPNKTNKDNKTNKIIP